MYHLLTLLFLFALPLPDSYRDAAQELPPVTPYAAEDYAAGSQNWMLSQDADGFLYVANNEGLLTFDGSRWRRYPSPNESIVRSVLATDERVYTGSYMDFGHWRRQADGSLHYTSLTDSLATEILPDEQFWNIIRYGDVVIFQSLQQFFLYRPADGSVTRLRPPAGIMKTFSPGGELYFTDHTHALYALRGGTIAPVLPPAALPAAPVHLWQEDDRLLLQTDTGGTFAVQDTAATPVDRFPFLTGKRIYSALALRRGGHAFGTISDGVYLTDADGRLTYHLDQENGLTNNTVLSLFQDAQNNVWTGSDNGLNCINLSSPIRKYTDRSGRLGTVYAAARHRGRLYLGSNQGLFLREPDGTLTLLPGTRGQVWSLYVHDGTLFCGHDAGTFTVADGRATPLDGPAGTWIFQPVPGRPDLLLQGSYRGLSVLERAAGGWRLRNRVAGFDLSARYLVLRPGPEAYVSHEYRGVYGLRLDDDYRRVVEAQRYPRPVKGKHAGLAGFRDSVYYASREGVFVLRDFASGFARQPELSAALPPHEYRSGRLTVGDDRLWFFTRDGLGYFRQGALREGLTPTTVPVAADRIAAPVGFENIALTGRDTLLIGTADGYLTLARAAVPLQLHTLHLTRVAAQSAGDTVHLLPLDVGGQLPYDERTLRFTVAVPDYSKYFRPAFQYRLLGLDAAWSDWTEDPEITFPGLPYGDYTLEVRSQLGRRGSENVVRYPFTVLRPWYASYPALLVYFLVALGLVYLLHRAYTRHYRRKQRMWQVENDRALAARERQAELEVTRLNNERLREDIAAKNREAALSTMNLVKKTELLQHIKSELLAGRDPVQNIERVVRTIDRNIDEAETWALFRDAFENADRDFFKKVRDRHPDLTSNDLRLCAYLRLNLSSKEIAPMLNISPRSVEVKRYRLRKKMGLDRDTGLTEYILDL